MGIASNTNFLESMQFLEKKLIQDDFGFQPVNNDNNDNRSSYSCSEKPKYNRQFLISENFDLLDFLAKHNKKSGLPSFVKGIFEEIKREKIIYGNIRRQRAIKKYKQKKNQRKNSNFIRYKVRKNLAEKRKRFKGKFIKNEKIDMKKAMQDFIKEQKHEDFGQKQLIDELKDLKLK